MQFKNFLFFFYFGNIFGATPIPGKDSSPNWQESKFAYFQIGCDCKAEK
jgi:hypothetical protein